MRNYLQKLERGFLYLDMYGHRVDLYINSKTMVRSKIGAFFSALIIGFCLYTFISNYISWRDKEYLQTISSTIALNVNELLRENRTYSFDFDSSNYAMYFVLQAYINNTYIPYGNLTRYFSQSFFLIDENGIERQLLMENCYTRKINEFLLQTNEDLQDYNEISSRRVCIKDGQSIKLGLFPQSDGMIYTPSFGFRVKTCRNSTENNFSCASVEEIAKMVKSTYFQTSIPRSIFDFNDVKAPRKRAYDYRIYTLDQQFCKKFLTYLKPFYLMTDEGLIFDEYQRDSVDFNVDDTQYETVNIDENDGILVNFELTFGLNQQIYYRKNLKLYNIIANLGGIINFLFIFGKILCYSYNMLVLKFSLINISFSNLDAHKTSEEKYNFLNFPLKTP